MIKKVISILLSVLMVLGLTSCGIFDKVVENVASANEKLIPKGSVEANVYSSEYSGLRFTKPDSWEYASDEELAAVLDQGISNTDGNSVTKDIAEMSVRADMMVKDPQYGTNILIMYENHDLVGMSQTVDERREFVEGQINEASGGDYVRLADKDITLCGETYHKQEFSYENGGIELIQAYYFRMIDGVVVTVTVTYAEGVVTTEEIESMFS